MSDLNLPSDWVDTSLEEVLLSIVGGGTPSKSNPSYYQGNIPWMSVKDMSQNILEDTVDHISREAVENSSTNLIPAGTPIIVTRMSLGKIVVAKFDSAINQDLKALFAASGVERDFLTAWYRSIATTIASLGTGTTVKGIRLEILKALRFPLPPLAEQKVIADKLDTLLAQVETTKARLERIPEILKRFRQSVLAAAVSGKLTEEWRFTAKSSLTLESFKKSLLSFRAKAKGLDDILENGSWISCQLGHVISVKSGDGLTAKDMALDGDIPVYGGNGINGYHNKSNVSDSVITIGRVGFYCGSVHLTEKQAWITDNALIVDFPEQLFSKDFMYLLLRATNLREDSASTAQPVISGAKIYPIAVKIPPFEEQNEIVRRVEELFTFTDGIEQKATAALARVNNLTQSILAKAFQGELTADWRAANPELISGDNSAAALLEKIKVEREVMKKQPKPKRSNIKKKTGSHMSKQIIKVVDALKEAGEPLSGQQLLAAAGYPSDSGTEQLEQFFLDIRKALISEKSIVKLERRDDGQDWFALAEPMANDE